MLYPTIEELTQGNKYNRYELALATAKCARLITDEYVRQHEIVEKSAGSKDSDRSVTVDRELRDEKAVKVAINRIYRGDFCIDENASLDIVEAEPVSEEPAPIPADLFAGDDDDDDDDDDDEEMKDEEESADAE